MIDRFIFWLKYEFTFYSHLVWLVLWKKVDLEMLARMSYTDVLVEDWTDKVALKNALKEKDMKEVHRILNIIKTSEKFDEKKYKAFLRRVKRYQIFYIILFLIILYLLVLIIGGK